MKKAVFFLIVLTVTGCSTWNEEDKDTWRQACMDNAKRWATSDTEAKTYCECVLQKMMTKYPSEEEMLEHIADLANDSSIQSCKPRNTTNLAP